MAYLECQDVIKVFTNKKYKIRVPALRGVELRMRKGELTALVGPSGSGKSTLLSLIAGLDVPSSGTIRVGDVVVTDLQSGKELDNYRRTRIGLLHQLPEQNLINYLTVIENVITPMRILAKFSHSEQKKRARTLLKDVDLLHRSTSKTDQLSGGEAQRLGIAIAIANDPEILLVDEPTGELDSQGALEIIKLFRYLSDDLGKTILVATHDRKFANMTKRTLKIQDGRIVSLHKETATETRDKAAFVDQHGNVRIPEEIRREAGITSEVDIEIRDGQVVIIPKKSKENEEES